MAESPAAEPHRGERDPLASESLARGTRLGHYELLVPIAVGGMARVWAARLHGQHGFSKLVAIKTLLPHLTCDPNLERMLVDEARIASGARHPNVVEIYDLGEERGVVYIAMEWVYGDSLSQILKAGSGPAPLDPRLAARIVADAAAGLHAAHDVTDEQGRSLEVVHRDVSPHNLLISLDGNVKVTDFGVAKAIGASHQATSAGQLKGKVAYMAPEQVTGGGVDRRSDVFSLGCVLYEVTTGRQPFRGEGEHHVMQELMRGAFPLPSRVVRGYPYDLERIVVRAMAPQPLHRYQTMDQMRSALEEWLALGGRGPSVTQSSVAEVMRERIGAEVERRREKIRRATMAILERGETGERSRQSESAVRASPSMTPSGIKPAGRAHDGPLQWPPVLGGGATGAPAVAEQSPRIASVSQYAVAASLGVIAAVALASGGFWVWKSMQPPARPASAVGAGTVTTEPAVLVPAPGAPRAPLATAAGPPILFKVIPDAAVLVANGATLLPSVRAIPRPPRGASERITVHAEGYADQTLTIDESAPPLVEVWLNESRPAPRKSGARRGGEPEAPALPANPY